MSTLTLTDRVMVGLDSPSLPVVARSVFTQPIVDALYELQQYEPLHCVTPVILNYVSLQKFGFTELSALEILQNHYRGLQ